MKIPNIRLTRQNLFIYTIVGQFNVLDCGNSFRLCSCKYLKTFDDIETESHSTTFMMFLNHKYEEDQKKLFNMVHMLQGNDRIHKDDKKNMEIVKKIFHKDGKTLQELNLLMINFLYFYMRLH